MRDIVIRICQVVALLIMLGLGAWLLEHAYSGMMRHHREQSSLRDSAGLPLMPFRL